MHVYGSPLHAFDRVDARRRAHRRPACARAGEEVQTLDGTLRRVDERDLLITDGEKPVALAAIMGGADSEVAETTTEVLLEAANFEPIGDPADLGAARPPHRGLEPLGEGRRPVSRRARRGARQPADRRSRRRPSCRQRRRARRACPNAPVVRLRPERTDRLVGLEVAAAEQRAILERLGFEVDDDWDVTVPTWRARDVTREIDLIEEVARVVLDRVPHDDAAAPRGRRSSEPRAAAAAAGRGRARRRRLQRGLHLEPRRDGSRPGRRSACPTR